MALAVLIAIQAAPAHAAGPEGALDSRAWELVSPVEKNGGEVAPWGQGVLQAAAQGGAVAYASEASFGEAAGAAPLSEYLATRGAAGWSTQNLTPPLVAGTYSAAGGDADPYLAFSADLGRALLSSGWACRGASPCAEENTPLGPGGPAGYRNLYRREGSTYAPLITNANFAAHLPPDPSEFQLAFEGASPGLDPIYLRAAGQLYEWSAGALTPIASVPPPPAEPAPPGGIATLGPVASAAGGARIFFTSPEALLPGDSDGRPDAYEWEALGTGSCTAAAPGYVAGDHGCLGLLSSGRSGEAAFVAASADGTDAYLLTAASLLPADADGLGDLYDARAGGGFPEPQAGVQCLGDECQGVPFVPQDPAPPTSFVSGPPNPPLNSGGSRCPKGKRRVVRRGRARCVPKRRRRHAHHRRRHRLGGRR
jgi:hypothetical protein